MARFVDLRLLALILAGMGLAWAADRYVTGAAAANAPAAPAFDRAAWRAWAAGIAPADLGPPATEDEVAAAEARLGTTFPPSYRAFLLELGQLRDPHFESTHTLPVRELRWLRDADPELIEAWFSPAAVPVGIPTFAIAALQDQERDGYVMAHLRDTLLVSAPGSETCLLLNPTARAGEEWQAWEFAHWIPGARPYPSFSEMLTDTAAFARKPER